MLKDLLQKDYQLLVAINQTGTISWDTFWIAITNAWNWIPFFILILWINFYFFSKREAWRIFFCTFLYLVFRKRIKVAFWVFLWPIPYAYSRMYLGVHFPTDIFIGILVGIATGTIGYWVYKKRQNTTLSP